MKFFTQYQIEILDLFPLSKTIYTSLVTNGQISVSLFDLFAWSLWSNLFSDWVTFYIKRCACPCPCWILFASKNRHFALEFGKLLTVNRKLFDRNNLLSATKQKKIN